MKEIILIADHPTSQDRLDVLNDSVSHLKKYGGKIALSSHISIPNFIVDKCDYYLYDSENPYYYLEESSSSPRQDLHMMDRVFSSNEFVSPDREKDYKYSCFKQFISAASYLKNFGYEIIHYIEGDTIVPLEEVRENFLSISSGISDSVVYSSEICMCGNFFSFSVKDVDFDFCHSLSAKDFYDIVKRFRFLENFILEIVCKNPNIKKKEDYSFMNTDVSNSSEFNPNKKTKQSFFKMEDRWVFLVWNTSNKKVRIDLFSQIQELNSSFEIDPGFSSILEITSPITNQVLILQVDGNLIKKYKLTPLMEQFRFNTCIKKEDC